MTCASTQTFGRSTGWLANRPGSSASATPPPRRRAMTSTRPSSRGRRSRRALNDAGVRLAEIEGAVTASQDFWEGRTISSMAVNEVAGGTLGSEAKVAADGVMALLYAMRADRGRRSAPEPRGRPRKESQADPHGIELAGFDPFYERALDPDETVAAGLQAGLYYARSGLGAGGCRTGRRGGPRAAPRARRLSPSKTCSPRAPTCDPAARARPRTADGRRHRAGDLRRPTMRAPRSRAASGWSAARPVPAPGGPRGDLAPRRRRATAAQEALGARGLGAGDRRRGSRSPRRSPTSSC